MRRGRKRQKDRLAGRTLAHETHIVPIAGKDVFNGRGYVQRKFQQIVDVHLQYGVARKRHGKRICLGIGIVFGNRPSALKRTADRNRHADDRVTVRLPIDIDIGRLHGKIPGGGKVAGVSVEVVVLHGSDIQRPVDDALASVCVQMHVVTRHRRKVVGVIEPIAVINAYMLAEDRHIRGIRQQLIRQDKPGSVVRRRPVGCAVGGGGLTRVRHDVEALVIARKHRVPAVRANVAAQTGFDRAVV